MTSMELYTLFQKQLDAAHQLVTMLEREREALEGKDPEQINEVVAEKQTLLTQLSELEIQRERLLASLGLENSADALDGFISEHDQTGKLAEITDELKAVLDACFQMNRMNGGIAELSYHYLAQSLSVLRGGEGQNETTYSSQGKTQAGGDNHRSLAKA